MSDLTSFKQIGKWGECQLSDELETNIHSWLDWCFLGIGAYINVHIPTSGVFGGNAHRLRPVQEPNYTDGQVWESFRKDWVWQSGVAFSPAPIAISGVFVNGTFQPATGVGTYAFAINYPLGRILFQTAIATNSTVTAEYSFKYVQLYTADAPWWLDIQQDSFRVDSSDYLQTGSGAWSVLSQSRVQLPAILVEAVPNSQNRPLEIGNSTVIKTQDVLLHILTEKRWDRNQLHDILTGQWQKRINAFDKTRLLEDDRFPLTADGALASGAMMYPDLIQPSGEGGYGWRQIRIMQTSGLGSRRLGNLEYTAVKWGCEVDLP